MRNLFLLSLYSLIYSLSLAQNPNWRIQYDSSKYYFNKADYAKTITSLKQLLPQVEKKIEDTSAYYEMNTILGASYIKTGKTHEAENTLKKTIAFYSSKSSLELHQNYFTSLTQLASLFYREKRYGESEVLFRKALQIKKETKGEKNPDYLILLHNYATIETLLKKYDKSDSAYAHLINLKKEMYGEKHPEYVSTLSNYAVVCKTLDKNIQAEELYLKISNIIKDSLGENNSEYINTIKQLGVLYKITGRYKEAEAAFITVTNFLKENNKRDSTDYAFSLNHRADLYEIQGRYFEAETLLVQTINIYKGKNIIYAANLSNLASLYRRMGQYHKSEELYLEAKEIFKDLTGEQSTDYASILNNLALVYDELGRYEEAESLYKNVLEITKLTLGIKHQEYATSLDNLALLYKATGHYDQSEPLFRDALLIRKETLGEKSIEYGESLNNLASLYQTLGRIKEAESFYLQALSIIKNSLGNKHPEYAYSLNNLAGMYESIEQNSKAEPLYNESLQILKETLGETHPYYAVTLNNLGLVYEKNKKFKEAETLYLKDLEIIKTTLGVNHPIYAASLSNLAGLNENTGKYNEAANLYLQAIQIRKNTLGNKHPDYTLIINDLARVYTAMGRLDEAELLWKEAITNYLYQIDTYFPSMSEREKEQFYNTVIHKFEQFNSYALLRAKTNPSILSIMYNNQLSTKALLLNASNKLRERILNSGDQILIEEYKDWHAKKEFLAQIYTLSKEEIKNKNIQVENLESQANELEKKLSLKSELFKNINEPQLFNWQDVQKKLAPGEAAIEIIRFLKYKSDSAGIYTDSVYYAALIISSDTKDNPDLVLLKNGYDLENRFIRIYRNCIKYKVPDEQAYNQYWRKIKENLHGITKVYFSPDGIYNKINLYSLKNYKTQKYVIDELQVEVVTNTKDLLEAKRSATPLNSIVLIGNPTFRTSGNSIPDESLPPLPGTSVEVTRINDMMTKKSWKGKVYTEQKASEEKIKETKDLRVLHIATHAFFEQDKEVIEGEDIDNKNPLLRSGLVLSSPKASTNKNREDGILTAYEAMNLNLDNTDLVVLSACETGLGKIKNGEGVYGLQRAFRVAGAKSIIISLWKVNDETTQKLMVTFYEEWLKTDQKREAFTIAQNKIRKEFSDPYFWGAFIMIGD